MLRAARLSLVLVVAVTVQTTWLAELRPFGVTGDLLLLVAVAGGMAAGPQRGAVVGFCAGLLLDSVQLTPFGLAALTYLIVGYAVGSMHEGVLRASAWIPVAAAFVASALGIILYVLLGQLLGQHFRLPELPKVVFVTAAINTVLCAPALWALRWVERAAPHRIPRLAR